jgi:GAF domain
VPTAVSRNYPALFVALDDVLEALGGEASVRELLRRSVESSADGFGAQKMLLLVVEDAQPWRLRAEASRGLTREEVGACESGQSVPGVSATCIREALTKGRAVLVQDAEKSLNAPRSGALRGQPYSVLCAPICDPPTGLALAVLYFQNHGIADAFGELDLAWLDVYAKALGIVVSGAGMPWLSVEYGPHRGRDEDYL